MKNFLSTEERLAFLEKHQACAPDREEMDKVTGQIKTILWLLCDQGVISENQRDIIHNFDTSPGAVPEPEPEPETGPVESMEAGESLKPQAK